MYNRLKYYLPLQYGNKEFIVPFLLVLKRIKCDKDSEENYKIKLEFHTDPTEQSVKGMAETKAISSFVQNLIEFTFDTIKEFQNYREALLVKSSIEGIRISVSVSSRNQCSGQRSYAKK